MERDVRPTTFRVASLGFLGLTVAAVGLGQCAFRGGRLARPANLAIVEGGIWSVGLPETWLLDGSGRGTLEPLRLSSGARLVRASISPWSDEQGRRQAIGLGWRLEEETRCTDFAIVRCTLPDGGRLASVPSGTVSPPVGPPCWRPGRLADVVYAGMDNQLYRLAFERRNGDEVEDIPDPTPRLLRWRGAVAGLKRRLVADPCWPSDARLDGRLLVTLRSRDDCPRGHATWEIWWLKLDESASEVIDAGPVVRGSPAPPGQAARFPSVLRDSAGRLLLAYLGGTGRHACESLCVAPLRFDPETGDPWCDGSSVRVLARECLAVAPLGSSDGRGVTVLQRAERAAVPRTFPLPDVSGLAGR